MPLTLSDADLARLEQCAAVLLAPLDHPDLDAWRAAVNAAARSLVAADSAIFDFAQLGAELAPFSDDMTPEYLAYRAAVFSGAPQAIDGGLRRVTARVLAVFNTTEIVAGDWDLYDADPAMSLSRSVGVRDSVGMITWAAPGTPAAVLQLNRDRYGTESFGDRGLLMFRLVRPAFTAGVRAMREFGSRRVGLASLLDAAGAAVVAHDERARQIHATPQVARVLGADPERAAVERAITRLARDLTYRSRAHGHSEHSVPPQTSTEVRTALGTYALVAFRVAPGFFGPHAAVMVSVAGGGPRMLGDADLRERFGLTGREVEVARLMASGLTNRAIAERIGTSPHTVRHQGERVFDKLRVRTRADIAAKLRSD